MFHIFEVNGSGVILESTEDALRVIHGNPDRTIPENQTKEWDTWAKAVLMVLGKMEQATVNGRFDPDAARVVLADELVRKAASNG